MNPDVCMEPGKGQILLGEGSEESKVTFDEACKNVHQGEESMEVYFFLGLKLDLWVKHGNH